MVQSTVVRRCSNHDLCIYRKRTVSPVQSMSTPRASPQRAPQGAEGAGALDGQGSQGAAPDWDINDTAVPRVSSFDPFSEWADGHCRLVYPPHSEEAKRHASGNKRYTTCYTSSKSIIFLFHVSHSLDQASHNVLQFRNLLSLHL